MSRGRFPQRVFRDGEEPDPRFSLANERTFLAWLRTALAMLPRPISTAALAICTPVAFDTNGTVRDARGFASITYRFSDTYAN